MRSCAQAKLRWCYKFCRNYYTRYDYEGVDSDKADAVMKTLIGKQVGSELLRRRQSNCSLSCIEQEHMDNLCHVPLALPFALHKG